MQRTVSRLGAPGRLAPAVMSAAISSRLGAPAVRYASYSRFFNSRN
ncbi:hypothetical protein ABT147_38905 [Streptomyces sp. NPDC001868]